MEIDKDTKYHLDVADKLIADLWRFILGWEDVDAFVDLRDRVRAYYVLFSTKTEER